MVLLADIGLDVLQLFIETLSFEALTGSLVRLGIPKGRTDGEFAAELRHRAVDRDTPYIGDFAILRGLTFQIEQDFESAFCQNSNNFKVNTLNRVIYCW